MSINEKPTVIEEFGGFGGFSSKKTEGNANKKEWQNFEFGTNTVLPNENTKNKDGNEEFFTQKKPSIFKPENEMIDRNETANLFEKYDKSFSQPTDSHFEQPFENPFLKKKESAIITREKLNPVTTKTFENFEQKSESFFQSNDKTKTNIEKNVEKKSINVFNFDTTMQEVTNVMEKSRVYMKDVIIKILN